MSSMTANPAQTNPAWVPPDGPVAAIDTHADTHHVVVIADGCPAADQVFATTEPGLAGLVEFLAGHRVVRVGVEGTSSYGQSVTARLQTAAMAVVEVSTVDRARLRVAGKSDRADAESAAWQVWFGAATIVPKLHHGPVEQLRILHTSRELLVKQSTQLANEARGLLVTAPEPIRTRLRGLSDTGQFLRACRDLDQTGTDPVSLTMVEILNDLGTRWCDLRRRTDQIRRQLHTITTQHRPDLRALDGMGPVSTAQLLITAGQNPDRIHTEAGWAMLTGTGPLLAASGKTSRHRYNRGGDRQANRAIHQVMLTRLRRDDTKAFLARKQAQGKTERMAQRCLKRYLAREIYRILTRPTTNHPETLPQAA